MNYIEEKVNRARSVLRELTSLKTSVKNETLLKVAELIDKNRDYIKEENRKDVEKAKEMGLRPAVVDRLVLNDKRIDGMVKVLKDVASLPDPVGEIIKMWNLPNGLKVGRMRVPLGVIFIVYESRPNVTIEASSLCMKSSNAVILRGGKEAINSNKALVNLIKEACRETGFPEDAVQFIDRSEREIVWEILKMEGKIDVAIPRGGESLIRAVVEHAKVPVIKHYKGVCNIYVDDEADLEKAYHIVYNAKVQRPSVCNAVENLVINRKILKEFFPKMAYYLGKAGVELRCDEESLQVIKENPKLSFVNAKPATEEDYYEEFLDLILAVKVVDDVDEAIAFIEKYGSKHSDAIITENYTKAMKFLREVDSAAVYVNASTRFTDGNEFGLGAEMGISTDKIHARGPMALEELTIPKFVILGEGQVRDNFGVPEEWMKEF
uniref:Gamma-glutamyl phosphate reductase n=2 Tax=Aquifex aeolicus TaxID=63363 RepID=PROA_AQUAE|nr:glutamate-5-semialdehyde dehydrogenase [Aquifex aeolicus]O67166.2 RecName: Full=Gamma-glutamyl phosphate reductase; Short=GPR; AltName: Full=Glutamate-5-semialdehyde dehydrogenase; AltName: Full=Glutamyl-gamma-semialdehyde dehydrogenase; Short=GSA dehydrogenase [Aquifex aeolicus VF5]